MLGLYGEADTGIPVASVEKMRDGPEGRPARPAEIVVYPDTPHAFFADYRPSYRKEQAEDGWKRMLDWFKKNGVARMNNRRARLGDWVPRWTHRRDCAAAGPSIRPATSNGPSRSSRTVLRSRLTDARACVPARGRLPRDRTFPRRPSRRFGDRSSSVAQRWS